MINFFATSKLFAETILEASNWTQFSFVPQLGKQASSSAPLSAKSTICTAALRPPPCRQRAVRAWACCKVKPTRWQFDGRNPVGRFPFFLKEIELLQELLPQRVPLL